MMVQEICEDCPFYGGTEGNELQAVRDQWYCRFGGYPGWFYEMDEPPMGCRCVLEHLLMYEERYHRNDTAVA